MHDGIRTNKIRGYSDLYPLVRIASNESDTLRFTKSVVLATQEFNIVSNPELLPTIHLYGHENLGNYEIIHCHTVIRSPSGKGIETLQKPEINLNQRSNFDDIARISESYKEYLVYLQNAFRITNNFTPDDLISLCYDSVLKRPNLNGSHNILDANEALCDVVFSSICRNALRMMRDKKYNPNRFIPPNESRYLSKITNSCNDIECLKDGSLNNITTFLAIYSLNVLEFPSTIDHVCLTLSTRYQHKFEEFNKYIKKEYNGINEYRDLLERMPNSPHIRKALDIEKEIENIKKRVYQIVEQSVAVLKKDKLIVSQGKKIVPNADSLIIKTNRGFQEVEMPSMETIRKRRKNIVRFDSYLKSKRKEWKNKR
ncbi:hypothetical protein ig2599ANME_1483 [groundwater metagenome]